jgi:DNA-binding transcriptional LysR family regulator
VALYGRRGQALWDESTAGQEFDAAGRVLLEEACRIADRLDRLEALIAGDDREWARIEFTVRGDRKEVRLVFDDALAEARQQANALRQIVTTLRLGTVTDKKTGELSALDQLAAKRSSRRSSSAG